MRVRRTYRLSFLVYAAVSSAFLVGAAAPESPDGARLRRDVEFLASAQLKGRMTGSPGAETAARYIADAFRAAGLSPAGSARLRDAQAPLDGAGYFQPFSYTSGVAEGDGNALSAEVAGRKFPYRSGTEFVPASISGSGDATGEVVFGGYGVVRKDPARDDYGSLDLRGKIVLLVAGAPSRDPHDPFVQFSGIRHKVFFARERGAAAVLVAAPRESDLPDPAGSRDFRSEGIPVLLVRRSLAQAWVASAGWTLEALESRLPFSPVPLSLPIRATLSAEVVHVRRVAANVVGILPGSDPSVSGQTLVVGAHFDHLGMGGPMSLSRDARPVVHPGADDNASGVAGLIELARRFAAAPVRPRRTILFIAFSGEELGLLGSLHYVANPLRPIAETVAMVNLDMIGRLRDGKLMLIGTGSSPEWEALVEGANAGSEFQLVQSESAFGASDQMSFYNARVPVLFVYTGTHEDYHRPSDTAEKLNYPGEVEVLDFVARCLETIDGRTQRPGYQQIPASKMPEAASPRVWFGSVPEAGAEVDGVRIAGVRERSPAEEAGLRPGDVVVEFGGYSVRNTQDFIIAITQYRGGDTVPLKVRRGGVLLTLTATLGGTPRED
jgi:aminopeptidase YwaD